MGNHTACMKVQAGHAPSPENIENVKKAAAKDERSEGR